MTTLAIAASPSRVRSNLAYRAALALAGSWIVAGLAQLEIKLPFTPVPITGASLGPGFGALSIGLYLAQGSVGLPFFSGGASGIGYLRLASVTGGYLWGFVVAASVVGALARRGWDRDLRSAIGAMFVGEIVLYAVAIPWLMSSLDVPLEKALNLGVAPFVVGDTLKLLLAAGLLPTAWRFVSER